MALSDLSVYSEYAYLTMTEVIKQQIDLFNAASAGTISLSQAANQGDFNDKAFFAKISGLVRRRNAYGSGAVASKTLAQLVDTMVKVAAGTAPVSLDPSQFKWIQMNPETAGAALGQQLAKDAVADMLNTSIMTAKAALSGVADVNYNGTSDTPDTLNLVMLNKGAAKFGDMSSEIKAWVMHSTPFTDLTNTNLANASNLFNYGSVNVLGDHVGRRFIVTDCSSLFTAGSPNLAYVLGLVPGGIIVEQNNDFTDNYETTNGDENILRTYQAEWSYNLGIKGFAWDKANGGKSPNDAALATQTNWDKIVTSHKDLAGVLISCN